MTRDKVRTPPRRFPPPWSVEDIGAAFVVNDTNGQKLSYVYYEDEPGRRSAAKLLSSEARRIAANIAKLGQSFAQHPTTMFFPHSSAVLVPCYSGQD